MFLGTFAEIMTERKIRQSREMEDRTFEERRVRTAETRAIPTKEIRQEGVGASVREFRNRRS